MALLTRYNLLRALKFAAFVVSVVYVFWHIGNQPGFFSVDQLFEVLTANASWFVVVFLLMLLNWSIEAFKWKLLLSTVESLSFMHSLRAVFSGVTVSFYTPNRVGEFAGRILHLDPGHRVRGALATFVGASAQVMLTFQAGLFALFYFREQFVKAALFPYIMIPSLIIIVLLPFLWLQIPKLSHLRLFSAILKRYPRYLEVFDHFRRRELLKVYGLSALRYLVFCTQQYLLLKIVGFNGGFLLGIGLAALSFFFITIVPSIALGELGMRSGVNLLVFFPYFANNAGILLVTFLLWFINLALPALAGALGILYIRIRKPSA